VGEQRPRRGGQAGGARGWRPGRRSLGATGGRWVAGAQVRSGGGGHVGRGARRSESSERERGRSTRHFFG
jgi:hypothetical protein